MIADLAVIILTLNEEKNITRALESVRGWAREVFVVDSYSTDNTVAIARSYDCRIFTHLFEDYSSQRNWALDNLPIQSEWILFLDADECVPQALRAEISSVLANAPREDGFYINRRFFWMGRWVRRGYYPTWLLRLVRRGKGRCEDREVNEHIVVSGAAGRLSNDLIHEDRKALSDWIDKHNRYAKTEAAELLRELHDDQSLRANFCGAKSERVRWLRYRIYNRLPPLIRPIIYFAYRYILHGGFLDGKEALTYHFLQALWFQVLIDLNYLEMKRERDRGSAASVAKFANSTQAHYERD